MTRDEHLAWCKKRALEYIERGDPQAAMQSMLSDLAKHPETQNHAGILLGFGLVMAGLLNTPEKVRDFVEGFN